MQRKGSYVKRHNNHFWTYCHKAWICILDEYTDCLKESIPKKILLFIWLHSLTFSDYDWKLISFLIKHITSTYFVLLSMLFIIFEIIQRLWYNALHLPVRKFDAFSNFPIPLKTINIIFYDSLFGWWKSVTLKMCLIIQIFIDSKD